MIFASLVVLWLLILVLALMLLHHSRRRTRFSTDGSLIALAVWIGRKAA